MSITSESECMNKLIKIYHLIFEKLLIVSILRICRTKTMKLFHDCWFSKTVFICYQATDETNDRKWTFTDHIIGVMPNPHSSTLRPQPCDIPPSLISTLKYICCIDAPYVSDVQLFSCDVKKKKVSNKTVRANSRRWSVDTLLLHDEFG